jgi:hypothetical protein
MLLRLLLTVMLALVAIPAPAAMPCHDTGAAMTMNMPGQPAPAPAPDKGQPPHFCTGCVPPSAMMGTRVSPPVLLPGAPPVARIAQLDLGGNDPPSLPPPRAA